VDDDFNHRFFDWREPFRKGAFQLPRCYSSLVKGLSVDQVSYGLCLRQVYPFVEECAKGKLAGATRTPC
jgi:hypothetical protein